MEIFKWAKDIEKIYIELIEKSKKDNLEEIQSFRAEQEQILADSIQERQNLVKSVLQTLSEDIEKEVSSFKEKVSKAIGNIVKKYEITKPQILEKAIQQLGLDLNA